MASNKETRPRLRVVTNLPSTECRHDDGRHGPCGGPSNGRECWDHKDVGTLTCCRAGTCAAPATVTST